MKKKIDLLRHQSEFLQSNSKKVFLLGGIGSGKSFTAPHFILRMMYEYPKCPGLLTANTYTQLMNATIETIKQEFDELGVPYECVLSGSQKRLELYNTKIFLYSLEAYDNMRGPNVGWWFSDETAFAKKEAVQVARGRLRDRRGPLFERHSSSPNGFNWAYDEFENMDAHRKTDRHHLVRAKTKDNVFLPEEYYESLLEDYGGESNPLAKQELGGEFVNMQAGAVYWAFDRGKHVLDVRPNKDYPVYVGQDFNIDNMCAPYVQRINGDYIIFDEMVLSQYGANTENAAVTIKKELKEYNIAIIPDSTATARKTSAPAGLSDIEILRTHGLRVLNTRNPIIRDRQNTLNMLFKKNKIKISPKCKTLIKELETLSARDKEGDCAHVSVGLGYIAWHFDPLITKGRSRNIQM
jgi:hypothetical protein